jgi:hypothetical protein
VRDGQTTQPFEELLDEEPERPCTDLPFTFWSDILVRSSFYAAHLQRWIDAFGRDALLVLTHEDLSDPGRALAAIGDHIGIDPTLAPDPGRRLNEGYAPRSNVLHRWVRRPSPALLGALRATLPQPVRSRIRAAIVGANERPVPVLAPATRQRLLEVYRDDTAALEDLLGRDLSAWRR